MVIGAVASALYIVDAYRDISIEAFTCLLLFKNFFSFGITWIAYDWFLKKGVWKTFRTVGFIQVSAQHSYQQDRLAPIPASFTDQFPYMDFTKQTNTLPFFRSASASSPCRCISLARKTGRSCTDTTC